jgi:hypothetical protein
MYSKKVFDEIVNFIFPKAEVLLQLGAKVYYV